MASIDDEINAVVQQMEYLQQTIDTLEKDIDDDKKDVRHLNRAVIATRTRCGRFGAFFKIDDSTYLLSKTRIIEVDNEMNALDDQFKYLKRIYFRCSSTIKVLKQRTEALDDVTEQTLQALQMKLTKLKMEYEAALKEKQEKLKMEFNRLQDENVQLRQEWNNDHKEKTNLKKENKKLRHGIPHLDKKIIAKIRQNEKLKVYLKPKEDTYNELELKKKKMYSQTINKLKSLKEAVEQAEKEKHSLKATLESHDIDNQKNKKRLELLNCLIESAEDERENNLETLRTADLELLDRSQVINKISEEICLTKQNFELVAKETHLFDDEVQQMSNKIKTIEEEILKKKEENKKLGDGYAELQEKLTAKNNDLDAQITVSSEKIKKLLETGLKEADQTLEEVRRNKETALREHETVGEELNKVDKESAKLFKDINELTQHNKELLEKIIVDRKRLQKIENKRSKILKTKKIIFNEIQKTESQIVKQEKRLRKLYDYKHTEELAAKARADLIAQRSLAGKRTLTEREDSEVIEVSSD